MLMGFHSFLQYIEATRLYERYPQLNEFRFGKVVNSTTKVEFTNFDELTYNDVQESIMNENV